MNLTMGIEILLETKYNARTIYYSRSLMTSANYKKIAYDTVT